MAIRALFLDFGNVFSTFDFSLFHKNLCKRPGGETEEQKLNLVTTRHYWDYDSGQIDAHEYHQRVTKEAGISVSQEVFEDCFLDIFLGHVHALDALLGRVRLDIPMFLLSNTNEVHYERYIRKHPFLWDHIPEERHVLSFRSGASKPNPKIYGRALSMADVFPGEAFFVDDLARNIEVWQKLGGKGVVWHGGNHDIKVLEKVLAEHDILV